MAAGISESGISKSGGMAAAKAMASAAASA